MAASDDLARIISGCKRGEAESFSQLIDMYAGRCYGYFYRLTGNRDISEELLSELFVKLVGKIGSFRGKFFDGWLFKIAANVFRDHLRSKQRRKRAVEAKKEQMAASAGKSRDSQGEPDNLGVQLGKLDEDTRELIILRFYSQMSFKQIAAMRGEPIGTTLSKVHRGLKRLRELME
jgi:RNA polymerase sigma-70 factor (ECF subfamily)